jgi:arginine decarboxylase
MSGMRNLSRNNPVLDGRWTIEESARAYGITDWGKGYFEIHANGHLVVTPTADKNRAIDLREVVEGLSERGIDTPVLLRFPDLTRHRLSSLREAFATAISDNEYEGDYACVYPIKVNQQRFVCEEVRDIGSELGFGLEAGSKPELLAVLGMTVGLNAMPIVCNGFKDREYIETVILATKLGRNIIPVVERFTDLEMIVQEAQRYGVRPQIGLRVKPSARGAGKWQASTGIRSKFGLSSSEVLEALEYVKRYEMADCLKMLHFHIGSQLSDIRRLKGAVTELAYFYAELVRMGAGLTTIDIGGGLGVDYDGSSTACESSMNYTIAEYASDVVYRIKSACDDANVPHPRIFSESGRAMVAYSTLLIFDVLGRNVIEGKVDLQSIRQQLEALPEDEQPQPVHDLLDALESLTDRTIVEAFHDALQARDEAISLFNLGYIGLEMRAAAEQLFWSIGREVIDRATRRSGDMPEELSDLAEALADVYYCNFSVFQSMPDSWAIGQLFPIAPIQWLDQEPTRIATLADITCDSDGKVDNFVDRKDTKRVLELHELQDGERYYLGAFLIGAYQEILGDLHNLFGDTHVVHVALDEDSWAIEEVIKGDTVKEVLGYVGYQSGDLIRGVRQDVERAVRTKLLTVADSRVLLGSYEQGMQGYTYLE